MRKLRKMTRRRLITIVSLVFVLALTTTTALAARPRFSSLVSFTLTSSSTGLTFAGMHDEPPSTPTLLAGHGNLADLVDGQQYKVVISAKGKAEVVCQSNDSFGKPSPKTIPISAKGSVTVSPPYDHGTASFDVVAGSLKINAKQAGCSFAYGDDDHEGQVTVVKVMYRSVSVALQEVGSNGKLDTQNYHDCKTKDEKVYCKTGGNDGDD